MAKYDVTYSCGHTGVVELHGKSEERQKRLAYLRTIECPDCYRARQTAAAVKQLDLDTSNGLPRLEGTEKQISWAIMIRAKFSENVGHFRTSLASDHRRAVMNNPVRKEEIDETHERNLKVIDWAEQILLSTQTSASWWIENRDKSVFVILKETARDAVARGVPAPVPIPEPSQKTGKPQGGV